MKKLLTLLAGSLFSVTAFAGHPITMKLTLEDDVCVFVNVLAETAISHEVDPENRTYIVNVSTADGTKSYTVSDVKEITFVENLGDANGDGETSVADLSLVASYILGNSVKQIDKNAADINGDSEITVADLSAIAAIILGN